MSVIPSYYNLEENDSTKFYVCKVSSCNQKLNFQTTGTTSHLWKHLLDKHPTIHKTAKQECDKKKERKASIQQPSTSSDTTSKFSTKRQASLNEFMTKPLDEYKKKKFDTAVLKFVISDGRPFEMAAGNGFKNLCSTLTDNTYVPPHPTTLARHLNSLHSELVETFKSAIKKDLIKNKASLTFDHWKADNNSNYLVVMLHYIQQEWNLQSKCLSVTNLENQQADHTALKTSELINKSLSSFGINISSIYFATTDTTKVMPNAAKILNIKWQGCAAHRLQLAIKSAFKVQPIIKNLINQVHVIANFFNSSTIGLSSLHKQQGYQSLPQSSPPLDVSTRFNSTFKLLSWVDQNEIAISLALIECKSTKRCVKEPPVFLNNPQIETLKNVLPLLKPICEATEILSSDKIVSVSLIVPCISVLKESMTNTNLDCNNIKMFRKELLKELDERFQDDDHLLAATYLDPRFKNSIFNQQQANLALTFIKECISKFDTSDSLSQCPANSCENVRDENVAGSSLMDKIFFKANNRNNIPEISNNLEDEIHFYNRPNNQQRNDNILLFWKENEHLLPKLSSVAKNLLAIQATNCSSERTNSVGGQIMNKQRFSLSNSNMETLIWCQKNKDLLL